MTPLRLWPGLLAVVVQWLLWMGLPRVYPEGVLVAVGGGVASGLVVAVWWVFFSRAPHLERWGALVVLVLAALAARPFLHPSIAGGMMGLMFPMYVIPVLSLMLVAWAVVSRNLAAGARRGALVVLALLGSGGFALLRTEGINGDATSDLAWRWTRSHEEQLITHAKLPPPPPPVVVPVKAEPVAVAVAATVAAVPVKVETAAPVILWAGFRGPSRDSALTATRIPTDWAAAKPVELWRKPVGPGWSSFAVSEGRIYTQEQRGDEEVVSCYDAATGEPVWAHRDAARFWESNAGAGPRGTPTLHGNRVYSFGGTGILNALDAATGARIWSRDVAADTETKTPGWGFAASPLVVGNTVIIAASGRLAAYDIADGKPRWYGPLRGGGYSSPHLFEAAGVTQIVMLSADGVTSVSPQDGKPLWQHNWAERDMPIVQPAVTAEGDLLVSAGDGGGIQRISVANGAEGWKVTPRWSSMGLKPYFNDFVIHDGHAYGFDKAILSCIDLQDGGRKWKGGRYGHGQLLLLREQGMLLVLSEEGELALVKASADGFTELARLPVLEGKTWNHPVIAGDRLYVRNATEMVALRLPAAP